MANCPKCNAEMGQMDVRCAACGYDFPDSSPSVPKSGLAYSTIADIALIVGGLAAGLRSVGAIVIGVIAAILGNYWNAFFFAPVAFFLCLAQLVVFIRIQNA